MYLSLKMIYSATFDDRFLCYVFHLNVQAMSNEFTNAVFLKVNVDENDVSWSWGGEGEGGRWREGRKSFKDAVQVSTPNYIFFSEVYRNNKSIYQICFWGPSAHALESYSSCSVCVSVTKLAATYLVCKSKVQCYKIPYGIPNTLIGVDLCCHARCILMVPFDSLAS